MNSDPKAALIDAHLVETPIVRYPVTARGTTVDEYPGQSVSDPYRWLEDDNSDATKAWVVSQNEVTFDYLARIPGREFLRTRITELLNYPRVSQPERKGRWLLFSKNDGLQNQAVIYLQDGPDGEPQVLLDPNTMSKDGTTRIGALQFNMDGSRIAYAVFGGGFGLAGDSGVGHRNA